MKQRHLRTGDDLSDDEVVVVRGGALDRDLLRTDAARYFSIYGTYGVSVFAAREITVDELAKQPPLVRFPILTLIRVGDLRASGLRLEPTGRNPRHFTLAWDSLDEGLALLPAKLLVLASVAIVGLGVAGADPDPWRLPRERARRPDSDRPRYGHHLSGRLRRC